MLICIVTVTGSTEQPTITWLENDIEISSSDMDAAMTVSMTSGSAGNYSRILTFNPLAISHAGTYMCRAILGGAMDTVYVTITVQSKCSLGQFVLSPYLHRNMQAPSLLELIKRHPVELLQW